MRYISIQFKQFMLHFFKEAYLSPESRKTIFRRHIYCKREQVPDSSSSSISTFKSQQQEKQQTTLSTFTSTKQLRHTTVVVKTPTMQAVRQTGQPGRQTETETERQWRRLWQRHWQKSLIVCAPAAVVAAARKALPLLLCLVLFVCLAACCKWKLESTHLKSVCVYVCQLPAQRLPACLPAWLPPSLFLPRPTDPHWLLSSASPTQQTHE